MEDKPKFDIEIENFLNNIESLRSTLPGILEILASQRKKASKEYTEFLQTECEYVESESHYLIPPAKSRKYTKLKKASTSANIAYKMMVRNYVISLVSQFDTYIGELMSVVFEIKPEIIDNSERQLSFSQLRTFDSVIDARKFIVEKEVESVLRDSHSEQFSWFEKKLDIKLRSDLPAWKDFIELTQRRNLFVHNNGKVSSQYLNVCKENGVDLDSRLKQGTELRTNLAYFNNAFSCVFEIGVKLNQVLRRKLLPKEIENADNSFLNISFELVHNEQFDLAKELYDFADKYIRKYSKQDLEYRILLNRAQTYKWMGDNEKCIQIINSKDWSACGEIFKLASSVLKDDYPNACKSMKAIGNNDTVLNKAYYNDWPIFKEFRKTDEFNQTYIEIYGEETKLIQTKNATQQGI